MGFILRSTPWTGGFVDGAGAGQGSALPPDHRLKDCSVLSLVMCECYGYVTITLRLLRSTRFCVILRVLMSRRLPSVNPSTVHAMVAIIRLDAYSARKAYDSAYVVGHTDTLIGASQNPTLETVVNPASTRLRDACRQSAELIRQAEQRLTAALVTLADAWPRDDTQPVVVDFPVYRKASNRENRLQARREYATDPQQLARMVDEARPGTSPRPHGYQTDD